MGRIKLHNSYLWLSTSTVAKAFAEVVYRTKPTLTLLQEHWMNKQRFAPCPIPPQKGVLQSSPLLTAGPNTEQNTRFLPTALQFSFCIFFFLFLGIQVIRFLLKVKSQNKDFCIWKWYISFTEKKGVLLCFIISGPSLNIRKTILSNYFASSLSCYQER